jgi:hypothetical protein
MEESIERYVMEIVHEQINRKQGTDNITRNFLRFLSSSCGLVEVIEALDLFMSVTISALTILLKFKILAHHRLKGFFGPPFPISVKFFF